jgi:hypothetical protein
VLVARAKAYKKAVQNEENVKAKKEALLEDIWKAERRGNELLKEVQGIWFAACNSNTTSGVYQKETNSLTSIARKSPLALTPPTTRADDKTTPNAPSRDRVTDRHKLQPAVEGEEEDVAPDKVEPYLKAAEELKQTRKHASATRRKLLVHQNTFSSQFEGYADEKRRNKDDLASHFGPLFIKRGRAIFQELQTAEAAFFLAKRAALEVGIPPDIVEYPDIDSDDGNETGRQNLKRTPEEDIVEPDRNRILEWLEDPEGPAKHKQRLRPETYEEYQLFGLEPILPSDSLSIIEECPKKREKLEAYKRQREADYENLDELMPDALLETDTRSESLSFLIPSSSTRWDKR